MSENNSFTGTTRTDSDNVPLDNRMNYLKGGKTPQAFLPSTGEVAAADALAGPTSITWTGASAQVTAAFTGAAKATKYRVQYRVSAAPTVIYDQVGSASGIVIANLTNGTAYEFRIRSEANDGGTFSDWSSWVERTPA